MSTATEKRYNFVFIYSNFPFHHPLKKSLGFIGQIIKCLCHWEHGHEELSEATEHREAFRANLWQARHFETSTICRKRDKENPEGFGELGICSSLTFLNSFCKQKL